MTTRFQQTYRSLIYKIPQKWLFNRQNSTIFTKSFKLIYKMDIKKELIFASGNKAESMLIRRGVNSGKLKK